MALMMVITNRWWYGLASRWIYAMVINMMAKKAREIILIFAISFALTAV